MPHSEGLQLSRDLGATYLELPSLNHVFVGRYFGSVVSADTTWELSCGITEKSGDYRSATVVSTQMSICVISMC